MVVGDNIAQIVDISFLVLHNWTTLSSLGLKQRSLVSVAGQLPPFPSLQGVVIEDGSQHLGDPIYWIEILKLLQWHGQIALLHAVIDLPIIIINIQIEPLVVALDTLNGEIMIIAVFLFVSISHGHLLLFLIDVHLPLQKTNILDREQALRDRVLLLRDEQLVSITIGIPSDLLVSGHVHISFCRFVIEVLEAGVFVDVAVVQEDLCAVFADIVLLQLIVELFVVVQDLIDAGGGVVVIGWSLLAVAQQDLDDVPPWLVLDVVVVDLQIAGVLLLEFVKHVLDLFDQVEADALHVDIDLPLHLVSESSSVNPCNFIRLTANVAVIEVIADE